MILDTTDGGCRRASNFFLSIPSKDHECSSKPLSSGACGCHSSPEVAFIQSTGSAETETSDSAAWLLLFDGSIYSSAGMLPSYLLARDCALRLFPTSLLLLSPHIKEVVPAMIRLAIASFTSNLTMPISQNGCEEIGGSYSATLVATINVLGNLAGFAAPTVGGSICSARPATGTRLSL